MISRTQYLVKTGLTGLAICWLLTSLAPMARSADPIVIDFEDENFDAWTVVDEDLKNLGDVGPSSWAILDSQLGFEGLVLTQGSNIWGEPNDHMLLGTIAYYNVREFENFRLEVDVVSNDNDGMGFVWGYQDLDRHYRFQMMNDRWPETPAIDGYNGPYLISHKRTRNASPWYEVMEVLESDEYIPYSQGFEMINHWILEVVDGAFTITTIDATGDENTISGFDDEYKSGYVGIQLYAQSNIEFDNFTITPLDATLAGDYDGSGVVDAADADAQAVAMKSPSQNLDVFDENGDDTVDGADRSIWVKSHAIGGQGTWFGDADLNGEFNSSDFVAVFTAGKYETGAAAGWAEGDWDGNGLFTSGDFVAAFTDGGYELGPLPSVNAVPEPASLVLILFSVVGLVAVTRRRSQL